VKSNSLKNSKILLTGGTGRLGTWLIRLLEDEVADKLLGYVYPRDTTMDLTAI
jgi:nucleoside-diphosphate-sugar epimerase